ncbi:beta-N-acetylhexosaminidase [Xylophilus sp.]|uniref:beta-N-acetylhexosaminidase n=1 Tax=Xylophilus sp. TaxID=2653893 RepID=UPI0013B85930|nr:beta-N-acetylhexosaminidase [Xylophilus sp.]KAF1045820.1 MAG: Beta-hexosaminidase [Xylophilus sp.]
MPLSPGLHAPLVIDVAGTELSAADRRRLAHPLVGGVILFARNWRDRVQLLELTAAIKAVRGDLLVAVDYEGGRVQRFRTDGFTPLPPMGAFGRRWGDDGRGRPGTGALAATDAAVAAGYVLARELRACGVDFSFTPVLDLDWRDASGASRSRVIGDRAFHRDPRVVTFLARALAHGLLQAGMAHCGKHFPGHGFVAADSHTGIPVDRRSLAAILADDAAPYQWLGSTLAAVMPAHVIYPKVDGRPAGFSRRWLQEILRGRLGFDGAIFSDDLSMEAARRLDGRVAGFVDAALAALEAGCDLVLLCNQSLGDGRPVDELSDGLEAAGQSGRWQPSEDSESRRFALLPQTEPLPWDELMLQPAYVRALEQLPSA